MDTELTLIPEDLRIRHCEVDIWRDALMLQYLAHFGQRSWERCRLRVSNETEIVKA